MVTAARLGSWFVSPSVPSFNTYSTEVLVRTKSGANRIWKAIRAAGGHDRLPTGCNRVLFGSKTSSESTVNTSPIVRR